MHKKSLEKIKSLQANVVYGHPIKNPPSTMVKGIDSPPYSHNMKNMVRRECDIRLNRINARTTEPPKHQTKQAKESKNCISVL